MEHIRARRSLDVVRMQIVKMIATKGPISRVLLSEKTGLSKMTISNYVSELISQGIVSEVEISGISPHGKGRRPTGLTISPSSPLICGILIKKCGVKWLENYALPVSMLGAMVFAAVITPVIGG